MQLVAPILVQMILTETDLECGHTKTTLHSGGVIKIFDVR